MRGDGFEDPDCLVARPLLASATGRGREPGGRLPSHSICMGATVSTVTSCEMGVNFLERTVAVPRGKV